MITITATAKTPEDQSARLPAWRGVNHVALVADDLDATVCFYDQVLGAPLIATLATCQGRHYLFRFGHHCTVAFFQYGGDHEPRFDKTAGVCGPRSSTRPQGPPTALGRSSKTPTPFPHPLMRTSTHTGRRLACPARG